MQPAQIAVWAHKKNFNQQQYGYADTSQTLCGSARAPPKLTNQPPPKPNPKVPFQHFQVNLVQVQPCIYENRNKQRKATRSTSNPRPGPPQKKQASNHNISQQNGFCSFKAIIHSLNVPIFKSHPSRTEQAELCTKITKTSKQALGKPARTTIYHQARQASGHQCMCSTQFLQASFKL